MSSQLAEKIQKSRRAALDKGTVIKMRKEEVVREKVLGLSMSYEYTWYQTPTKVGMQIPYSVEKKEDLAIKFHEDRVTVQFAIAGQGGTYKLDLTLFRRINKVKSNYYLRLKSIEIVMEKKDPNVSWTFLRRDGLGVPEAAQKNELGYPSSAKIRHNWDKFDKEIAGDMLDHYEDYGEDAGSVLFKQIYANGDENKRRAMIKSFQTSGGTVLSSDWSDVANKDFEGRDRP